MLAALELAPGDEVLTSDEEHPGLQGPLAAARAQRGITVRAVPFALIADAITPSTRLVACSHVSWVSGRLVPDLSAAGDIPVLLDGAQGVGAVPIDVTALGCAFYAGSGQKWLCGPVGSGMLWVVAATGASGCPRPGRRTSTSPTPAPAWTHPRTRAPRATTPPRRASRRSPPPIAALDVLGGAGWDAVHERAATLADELATALEQRGREVAPRDRTTLVAWTDPEPAATRELLAEAGVLIRDLPGTGLLRASVGAWNDASDIDRLLTALP